MLIGKLSSDGDPTKLKARAQGREGSAGHFSPVGVLAEITLVDDITEI